MKGERLTPYQFPPDIDERIQARIDRGHFQSADEVIREAINTLEKRQNGLEQLRAMVREADDEIDRGRIAPFSAEATKQAVLQRLEKHGVVD